ncbi:hypothetical protein [Candidatus Nitrosocosmicus hydrocola]|uniref:hypothetical protein n=1 Tax=Candidatus Nitrosocosmicus hydrocola TaxID=1826872 RepID=UPI0011E5FF1C|nr:hypothetical protein [Candidatus Nitrosocosmicus hydrocola]
MVRSPTPRQGVFNAPIGMFKLCSNMSINYGQACPQIHGVFKSVKIVKVNFSSQKVSKGSCKSNSTLLMQDPNS